MNNSTSLNPEYFPERFELNDTSQNFLIVVKIIKKN